MLCKKKQLSNFSNARQTTSSCYRPDNEEQLSSLVAASSQQSILARGNGLSYSDCCLNDQAMVIDTSRLNHFLSFDETTGIVVCQPGVTFADLLKISPYYIPAVIPGTLGVTVAGGIANDVHGKNNPTQGNFGHHIAWLDLLIGKQLFHCDSQTNSELFYATIGGLGLTGIIKRAAIKLRKSAHFVEVQYEKYTEFEPLLTRMQSSSCDYDYQVAWLDLLNKPRALLSLAQHCDATAQMNNARFTVPKLPLRLIYPSVMKQFNRCYFNWHQTGKKILPLAQFNNPLDALLHWNRFYGKKGLLQFQAVVGQDIAHKALQELLTIIQKNEATPTLAVLKYFNKKGSGLLSFTQPGFTFAIDFINNDSAQKAIPAMNEWITQAKGKIYLAKDLFLTQKQFAEQYPQQQFSQVLAQYNCTSSSDLARRLGLSE